MRRAWRRRGRAMGGRGGWWGVTGRRGITRAGRGGCGAGGVAGGGGVWAGGVGGGRPGCSLGADVGLCDVPFGTGEPGAAEFGGDWESDSVSGGGGGGWGGGVRYGAGEYGPG